MPSWLNRTTVLGSLAVLIFGVAVALIVMYVWFPAEEPAIAVEAPAEPEPVLSVVIVGSGHVTSDPTGINCEPQCQASFPKDSIIDLVVTPDAGYQLDAANSSCVSGSIKLENDGTCNVKFVLTPQPEAAPEDPPAPKPKRKKSPVPAAAASDPPQVTEPAEPAPAVSGPTDLVISDPAMNSPGQSDRTEVVICYRSLYAYSFVYVEQSKRNLCRTPKVKPAQSGYHSLNPR